MSMKRILSRLSLLGLVAAGAMSASVAASSAQCMPGSTDCPFQPPYTFDSQPGARGEPGWRSGRHHLPDWNNRDRDWQWRQNRDNRSHHRRHVRRGGNVTIGIWGGPGYYDDGWYEPNYRYVEPAPRYKVIHLSAAHVDWCYRRYKTYRASDNTYKPTKHTRRQCISPYS